MMLKGCDAIIEDFMILLKENNERILINKT